jgi:hypothetical protein
MKSQIIEENRLFSEKTMAMHKTVSYSVVSEKSIATSLAANAASH